MLIFDYLQNCCLLCLLPFCNIYYVVAVRFSIDKYGLEEGHIKKWFKIKELGT